MASTDPESVARIRNIWHSMSNCDDVELRSIDELCRLCMSKEDELIPLFYETPSFLSSDLPELILDCTSVKVCSGDGLPPGICQQCHEQLEQWAEFRQRCLDSDARLQNCLEDKGKLQEVNLPAIIHTKSSGTPRDEDVALSVAMPICKEETEEHTSEEQNEVGKTAAEQRGAMPVDLTTETIEDKRAIQIAINGDDENVVHKFTKKRSIKSKKIISGEKRNCQKKENRVSGHLMKKVHEPRICDTCGKTFKTNYQLKTHIMIHSGERPFLCNICGKGFTKSGSLTVHLYQHTGEKRHVCGTCGKRFGCTTTLASHFRVHTGERPYACSLCGKSFSHRRTLTRHSRSHTKEKPFECSVCRRAFSDKWHLTQHFRLHTGEKPYSCHLCEQSFTHNVSLREHLRQHSGEMWSCTLCPKKYSSKSSLTAHTKNVHRDS